MNIRSYRDDDSEYQDHMDISRCIPSIKISSLSLVDSPEEQVTLDSSDLPPKEAVRQVSLFFEIYMDLIIKSSILISFCIINLRRMTLPLTVPRLSTAAQTESGLPQVSKWYSGFSSDFAR